MDADNGELPEGWALATLVELLDSSMNGYGKRKQDVGSPAIVLRLADITSQEVRLDDPRHVNSTDDEIAKYRLRPDDLLAIRVNGSADLVARLIRFRGAESPVLFCDHFIRLRLRDGLVPEYLRLYGDSPAFRWYVEVNKVSSAGQNTISQATLEQVTFPLPPLAEQRRIVAAVAAVLAKVSAVRERLNRVPAILKRFRQAVLSAACSGRLTADWREKNAPDTEWQETSLEQLIVEKPRNGYSPKAADRPTEVKSLTLTATTSGVFKPSFFKYLDIVLPADSYLWLQPGDILIQRSNTAEYVGVSAIYDGKPSEFVYPDLMMKMRTKVGVEPRFLWYALSEKGTRNYLRSCATGTAGSMPKINQGVVCATPIRLPPLAEQQEIVRRVGKLFALADVIEARLTDTRRMADRLTRAVLAKAFRGELVPTEAELARREGRTYEPAADLLARVRAERQQPATKPARTRKPKADPA